MCSIRFNPSRGKPASNFHKNYSYRYQALIKVSNGTSGDSYAKYNETASSIQNEILRQCADEEKRVRFIGSTWSLSEAPYCKDYLVDISSLNLALNLSKEDMCNPNANPVSNYCFVQSGKKIKSITKYLQRSKRSLKTSGASNGQSIAGAISTGVHGSAFDIGAIQDTVVGLDIITSDRSRIYLERESNPVLNDSFAQKINSASVTRNDDLFNAALVSMGACGYIYGVVLEVEEVYLLERHIINLPRNQALGLAKTQEFENSSLLPCHGERPYHYKLYINAYQADTITAEVLYKRSYTQDYSSPIEAINNSFFGDMPKFIGKIISLFATTGINISGALVEKFKRGIVPSPKDSIVQGTLGEIFYDTQFKGSLFAISVAVDASNCEIALCMMEVLILELNVPGYSSIRLVKGTDATLGFTKFSKTAIVEVDGVQWTGLQHFLQELTRRLVNSDMDFSLHWGKNADWSARLVNRMYGNKKSQWQACRNRLVSERFRKTFSSKFLDKIGLS